MGSLSWAEQHYAMPMQAYKISKAALNMLHKITSLDLADEGFTLLAISPGVSFQRLLEHPPPLLFVSNPRDTLLRLILLLLRRKVPEDRHGWRWRRFACLGGDS